MSDQEFRCRVEFLPSYETLEISSTSPGLVLENDRGMGLLPVKFLRDLGYVSKDDGLQWRKFAGNDPDFWIRDSKDRIILVRNSRDGEPFIVPWPRGREYLFRRVRDILEAEWLEIPE